MPYPVPSTHGEGVQNYLCIPVPENEAYRAALFGALVSLGRWYNWERDQNKSAAKAAQFFRNILTPAILNPVENCGVTKEDNTPWPELIRACGIEYDDRKHEDESNMPTFQKFGNLWYIGLDCGCGEIEWVSLGQAVSLDPASGGPLPPEQSPGPLLVDTSNTPAFNERAAQYMLNRFLQWVAYSLNLAQIALDSRLSEINEVMDFGLQALGLTDSGIISQLEEIGYNEIEASIGRNKQAFIDNWTFTHNIGRDGLRKWVNESAPILDGVVPLRFLMLAWLEVSYIAGYSGDLAKLAADEVTGIGNYELPALPEATEFEDTVVDGTTYRVYKWTQLDVSGPWGTSFDVQNFEAISTYASGTSPLASDRYIEYAGESLGVTTAGRLNDAIWIGRINNAARTALYQVRPAFDSSGTYQTLLSQPTASSGRVAITGTKTSPPLVELYIVARVDNG